MKIIKENCIAHIAAGKPQAIEYIVAEYGDLIKTVLCSSLGHHRQRREECFNDVLMAVWKTGSSFDSSKGSMTSWLAAVAKHNAVDFLRKEIRHDNRAEALTEPAAYDEYSGETVIDELLECLCEEDRELLIRRYVYEQTAEEITASTGLKRDVVYSRLSRGRKKIRKTMEERGCRQMKDRFEIMTQEEKTRAIDSFYKEVGIKKPTETRKKKRWISVAVAACIVLVFSFTPAGTSAWAKAREAFMGIGQYLGNSAEDDYVTVIDQTQKKGDITFTLNEVVASDYLMRFSVTVEKDDGTVLRLRDVGEQVTFINGLRIGGSEDDIMEYGTGSYGGKRGDNKGIYFLNIKYAYDMPLYPEIETSFYAEGQMFTFKFTLDNKKFKQATKEVEINKVSDTPAREVHIGKLVISPIEQYITIENKDEINWEYELDLYGTDETGDKVWFVDAWDKNLFGWRVNEEKTSYELNYDVKSYTLQFSYRDVERDERVPVGEPFTIDIP